MQRRHRFCDDPGRDQEVGRLSDGTVSVGNTAVARKVAETTLPGACPVRVVHTHRRSFPVCLMAHWQVHVAHCRHDLILMLIDITEVYLWVY